MKWIRTFTLGQGVNVIERETQCAVLQLVEENQRSRQDGRCDGQPLEVSSATHHIRDNVNDGQTWPTKWPCSSMGSPGLTDPICKLEHPMVGAFVSACCNAAICRSTNSIQSGWLTTPGDYSRRGKCASVRRESEERA